MPHVTTIVANFGFSVSGRIICLSALELTKNQWDSEICEILSRTRFLTPRHFGPYPIYTGFVNFPGLSFLSPTPGSDNFLKRFPIHALLSVPTPRPLYPRINNFSSGISYPNGRGKGEIINQWGVYKPVGEQLHPQSI